MSKTIIIWEKDDIAELIDGSIIQIIDEKITTDKYNHKCFYKPLFLKIGFNGKTNYVKVKDLVKDVTEDYQNIQDIRKEVEVYYLSPVGLGYSDILKNTDNNFIRKAFKEGLDNMDDNDVLKEFYRHFDLEWNSFKGCR